MSAVDRSPVLVSTARTPVGRFGGALAGVDAVDLGATAVRAAVQRAGGLLPDQVLMGNVVQAGNGQNPARIAAVRGGLSTCVPAVTFNDVCLASMTATGVAASLVRSGEIDTALVGGFESMSRALHGMRVRQAARVGHGATIDLLVNDGLWCSLSDQGMGPMSDAENAKLGVTREAQDRLALASHLRAHDATVHGRLADEITRVDGVELDRDEGVRFDTTIESLGRLPAAFVPGGTITAGNSSQMSDAGAAGMLTCLGLARSLGLEPTVEIVARAVVAGPDSSLHLKPAAAVRQLLKDQGLARTDVGCWEINEAFAGVVAATCEDLGLDPEVVNADGGAIALGHPLGASGFRMLMTLARQMRRTCTELGIAAICGGGGQGQAMLIKAL